MADAEADSAAQIIERPSVINDAIEGVASGEENMKSDSE